jgi:hypothetical protein
MRQPKLTLSIKQHPLAIRNHPPHSGDLIASMEFAIQLFWPPLTRHTVGPFGEILGVSSDAPDQSACRGVVQFDVSRARGTHALLKRVGFYWH